MFVRLRLEQLEELAEAVLSTDSQDLDPFRQLFQKEIIAYCDDVWDLTGVLSVASDGVLSVASDGEFSEVWITCWKRPFDSRTEYLRIV